MKIIFFNKIEIGTTNDPVIDLTIEITNSPAADLRKDLSRPIKQQNEKPRFKQSI